MLRSVRVISGKLLAIAVGIGSIVATPNTSDAQTPPARSQALGGGVEVIREIPLEPNRWPLVKVLTRTSSGGYIVAGSFGGDNPWATQVDATGAVAWRHEIPDEPPILPKKRREYGGAIGLPDGGALLCGTFEPRTSLPPQVFGLLTRLDQEGGVVSRRLLAPKNDERFRLSYLHSCIPWGGGYAVVGEAAYADVVARKLSRFHWVLALSATGDIKWETLVPFSLTHLSEPSRPIVAVDGDLIISTRDSGTGSNSEVMRITADGRVGAQQVIDVGGILIQDLRQRHSIALISVLPDQPTLHVLNERLESIRRISSRAESITVKRAYRLTDGTLALFGYQEDRDSLKFNAAILRLDERLSRARSAAFVPKYGSPWLVDAVPTDQPNEFATIRETRGQGAVLALIRFK